MSDEWGWVMDHRYKGRMYYVYACPDKSDYVAVIKDTKAGVWVGSNVYTDRWCYYYYKDDGTTFDGAWKPMPKEIQTVEDAQAYALVMWRMGE